MVRPLARIAVGVVAVALLANCTQRRAPVYAPQGVPRVDQTAPQPWPDVPTVQPTYPGSPQAPVVRPLPPVAETFDQPLPPASPTPRIAQAPLPPPEAPALNPFPGPFAPPPPAPIRPRADEGVADERPGLASNDYERLLPPGGSDGDEAGLGSATRAEAERGGENRFGAYPGLAAANAPVKVAMLLPTSDRRVQGEARALAAAARLALAEADEPRLDLELRDTGGDPAKAAAEARAAIEEGAQLILGPLFSGSAAAVRQVAAAEGVNVLAFTTDESVLGQGLYTLGQLPRAEIERILRYAASEGRTNVAALAPDSRYGALVYQTLQAAGPRTGANVVRVQPFQEEFRALDPAAKDFAGFYGDGEGVDAVLIATSGRTLQGLASYLAFRKVLPTKVKYMGLGNWDNAETLREPVLKGAWFPGIDPDRRRAFDARYQAAGNGAAAPIAILGHDAVKVAADILAGSTSARPFTRAALEDPSGFEGASGVFRLRADGRIERLMPILSVGGDGFRVVDPAPRSFGAGTGS